MTDTAASKTPRARRSLLGVLLLEILLPGLLITSAVVTWAWRAWPPVYESMAMLRVEPSAESRAAGAMILETQAHLATSPAVLSRAIEQGKLDALSALLGAGDREARLREMVRVEAVPNSFLLRITARAADPATSAVACKALAEAYRHVSAEQTNAVPHLQIKNLEAYQRDLQNQADAKQDNLEALMTRAAEGPAGRGGIVPASGREALPAGLRQRVGVEEYRRLGDELSRVELEMIEAKARVEALTPVGAKGADNVEDRVAATVGADPEAAALRRQIAEATAATAKAEAASKRPDDPARVAAVRRLADLSGRFAALFEEARTAERAKAAAGDMAPASRELVEAQTCVDVLKIRASTLEAAMSEAPVTRRDEGATAVKIAMASEELSSIKEMQDSLARRLEQLRFESSKDQLRIATLVEPRTATWPVSEPRRLVAAATPVAVFGLLTLAALLRARRRRLAAFTAHPQV